MRYILCFAFASVLVFSGNASAQPQASDASADTDEEIVVTGRNRKVLELRAKAYVMDTGLTWGHRQASRWEDPVCPKVIGLTDAHNDLVKGWVREAADDIGVPLAKPGCRANILVTFVDDGRSMLQEIRRKRPRQLAKMRPSLRDRMMTEPAAMRSWYQTEYRNKNGMPLARAGQPGIPTGDSPVIMGSSATRIGSEVMRVLRAATILVDKTEAHGMPLISVAR
ncbi:MAG: hypothetical protein AAF205_08205, partial [Pseudomonadota bacterium]